MPDISLAALRVVLRYVYTGQLAPGLSEALLQEVLLTAEVWMLEALLEGCSKQVLQQLQPENAVGWLVWTDQREGCSRLRHWVVQYVVRHWSDVVEVEGALGQLLSCRKEIIAGMIGSVKR